jgi:hypothetical protein
MPNFYADTAEALEDVAVSASEALGAVVSFRVYIIFFLKTDVKSGRLPYSKVPMYLPEVPRNPCVATGGMKFSAVYIFLRISTLSFQQCLSQSFSHLN